MADENVTLTPTFIVYINGTRLGVDHEASVRQIVVEDAYDAPATCRIILSDMERKWVDSEDFELAQSVSVMLGFKDAVEEVFNGEIIGSEVILKKQADATVILSCSNKMHRLFKVKKHRVFNEMTDEDIIGEIASEHGLTADLDALSAENVVRVQESVTDYDFLRKTAADYNYRFWVNEDNLCMKAEVETSDEDIVLEWGKTLLDYRSTRNTGKLLTQVEVVGWDPMTEEGFSGTMTPSDIVDKTGDGSLGAELTEEYFGERLLVIKDLSVKDEQQAEERALAVLTENSYSYMSAQSVCEGDNRIRAGAVVEIKEAGERFSGPFQVRRALHNFHASAGYTTKCELVRNTEV